jgi:replicative DNA helicase
MSPHADRARQRAREHLGRDGKPASPPIDGYPAHQLGREEQAKRKPAASKGGGRRAPAEYIFDAIDSATFAQADYRLEWLVKRLLVIGQPALIGGPQKALKTSLLIDLAISLGTGTPFLDEFQIPRPMRVAVLSGESGQHTLQETARRVCQAKDVDLADVDVLWGFTLPKLASVCDLGALQAGLEQNKVEVVAVDPLYLSLLAGADGHGPRSENVFEMGPLLMAVARACLDVGVTPILAHHTRKGSGIGNEPLELTDMAYSGIAEFARQWLLVCRREKFEPGTGQHKLWLNIGGSAGHGGLWAVDVYEGIVDEHFAGRCWEVTVTTATEARQTDRQLGNARKKEERTRRDQEDDAAFLEALDNLIDRMPVGGERFPTKNEIRTLARLSGDRTTRAVDRLIGEGIIAEVSIKIASGVGLKVSRAGVGYWRPKTAD